MGGLDNMSAKKRKEIAKKGGIARSNALKSKNKTIEDVVYEKMTDKTIEAIVDGLIESGKKGSVAAVETLIECLEKKRKEKEIAEQKKKDKFKLQH